jgi:hypothetical protein
MEKGKRGHASKNATNLRLNNNEIKLAVGGLFTWQLFPSHDNEFSPGNE